MIMKQPELGRKLSALRIEKNMTQEDLVEACNVSVRTIQRIESGEVTPRLSTIKILMTALGEEMDYIYQIPREENQVIRNLQSTETWLQIAWISGIVAFILGFMDTTIEAFHSDSDELDIPLMLYLSIKLGSLGSYLLFYIGIIKLGDFFENRLLSIACYLQVALTAFMTATDILSVFYEGSAVGWVAIGTGLLMGFGASSIVLGMGFIRLQDAMGRSARAAGILEIIGGICLLTIILVILGLVIYLPAMIIEIILLYKAYEYVRAERLKT